MSTTNEIWLPIAGHLEKLDLDEETNLLPTFQSNDRTKPESIQADYSPEFSIPGSSANHRRLKHAAASQPATGAAYVRVPCVLTSGGVETLPLALLYLKGNKEGRILLQLFGGNKRLVEALGEKTLNDLDLNRFNHAWLPPAVLAGLAYSFWTANSWGYELYDRGKPLDFRAVDPYTLYPSCKGSLVFDQILADAGFTADSLLTEPLFDALNVPTGNPYTYPQDFRDARALTAGPILVGTGNGLEHTAEFAPEKLNFAYTARKPYRAPTATTYLLGTYTIDVLGYYDVRGTMPINYGCDDHFDSFGHVSCKVMFYVNGAPVFDADGNQIGQDVHPRIRGYKEETFSPKLEHYLLQANDVVEMYWQGDEWEEFVALPVPTTFPPTDPRWRLASTLSNLVDVGLPGGQRLYRGATFSVTLLEDFPPGGLIKLQQWLSPIKQLDYIKTVMLLLGLTIQADDYEPHLHLAPGSRVLANLGAAKDWTSKRDASAAPGRQPERDLVFRFGSYGQKNLLKWKEDEKVTAGYGDGLIEVADEVLAAEYTIATLPFAATEVSNSVMGLLYIGNFEADDVTKPNDFQRLTAQPRITLRTEHPSIAGQLIMMPATNTTPATLAAFTTIASYFESIELSLVLNETVLGYYWTDLKAMLNESRYLVEYYRLTPADIAELDYTVPIWDGLLGDFFCVNAITEFDPRRSVEVQLIRLNATHLPYPY